MGAAQFSDLVGAAESAAANGSRNYGSCGERAVIDDTLSRVCAAADDDGS